MVKLFGNYLYEYNLSIKLMLKWFTFIIIINKLYTKLLNKKLWFKKILIYKYILKNIYILFIIIIIWQFDIQYKMEKMDMAAC